MRIWAVTVILACAGTLTSYAQKAPDSNAGTKIMALENLWGQASAIKDLKSLNTIFDDAIVYVDVDGGLMSKAEVLADVKRSPALQFIPESMDVHLHGDTAIITGTYWLKRLERGKPIARRRRFVDTWRYKDGIWLLIASLSTPIEN
jgi:ketosteroid isomerase-like protein